MALVVGEISYTNILPLYYYIDREKLTSLGCKFIPKIPAELNQDMAQGSVDIGSISSFSYGQNFEKYTLLPHLSVSSKKAVGSIFLFSKKPIEELDGARIALTSSSATSINLAKVILKHFYKYENEYEMMYPSYTDMMLENDACVLIGDDAILTLWQEQNNIYRYDLGELWNQHTGLSMTYAVFAVRNEVLQNEKNTLEQLYYQFLDSKERSEKDSFQPMIQNIRDQFGGGFQFWHEYFQGLCYDLGENELTGLKYFYELAYQYGYLNEKVNNIAIWNVSRQYHSI